MSALVLSPALVVAYALAEAMPGTPAPRPAPTSVLAKLPPGYRDWRLISVAHEAGNLNDLRAILGNDIAVKAYREGTLPFPDGAIIARLAWEYVPSAANNKVFGQPQSYVAGLPKEGVQFMVKDARKYAATGGWGYAQFNEGVPVEGVTIANCAPCHQPAKPHDYLFTEYAP
ncbi:cytochrome P460 [Hymenobacter sp. HMF4947]|uniref:Cytochrome P460 n=1 Tax=Hymenobacter ginkgonis TaxID=2682976 RepID=A0A7K1TLL2_9BACT|nr:cytochrome P460 [Hymenobacter ginkgonis]